VAGLEGRVGVSEPYEANAMPFSGTGTKGHIPITGAELEKRRHRMGDDVVENLTAIRQFCHGRGDASDTLGYSPSGALRDRSCPDIHTAVDRRYLFRYLLNHATHRPQASVAASTR
jgi:hypothetical protein